MIYNVGVMYCNRWKSLLLAKIERLGAQYLSCDGTKIACTRADAKKCLSGIGM